MARVARALLPFALLPHTAAWHPTFQWVLDTFYYTTSSLPSADDSGSNLVPDPRIGRQGPTCLCDVTVGRCDTGCCCDSDCSYEAIRLGGYFGCTSNGTVVEISVGRIQIGGDVSFLSMVAPSPYRLLASGPLVCPRGCL
jgi:hypothetical protein